MRVRLAPICANGPSPAFCVELVKFSADWIKYKGNQLLVVGNIPIFEEKPNRDAGVDAYVGSGGFGVEECCDAV
jgi:hypothetical protein